MSTTRPALRTLGIVVFILVLLGLSFGLFSYSYVSEKRDYLTKRNLRAVSTLGSQLKLKIDNYSGSVLSGLASVATKECNAPGDPCGFIALSQVATMLADSRKVSVELLLEQDAKQSPDLSAASDDPNWKRVVEDAQKQFNGKLRDAFFLAPSLKLDGTARFYRGQGPVTVSILPPDRESSQLYFVYSGPVGDEGFRVTFRVMTKFDDLVGTFRKDIFDNILIVSTTKEENTVIFQKPPSDAQVTKLINVQDRNGADVPFTAVRSSTDVFDLNLAGANYKAFLQPLRLSITTESWRDAVHRETIYGDWTICGLVRADRFRTESLAISYTVLLVFLFVFVMVAASWPLLRLWSIGPGDHLGRSDVIFVSISVLTISGLLTFFLADMYAYSKLENTFDKQLQEFAEQIVYNFQSETQGLQRLLRHLDPKMEGLDRRGILMDNSLKLTQFHVYFDLVSQIGNDGKQINKWTTKKAPTPLISVAERDYFRKIKNGQGWPLNFNSTKDAGDHNAQYWLEPIISWTTGETRVELSTSSSNLNPSSGKKQIVSVAARLISLQNTVTLPGFGYAVVDEDAKVLFHSDLSRTLVENFVEECDRNRLLQGHLRTRASEWINAAYMGRAHRLYVIPLSQLPWTLIVFRDKEIGRTANVELLTAAISLYFFCGLVFLMPVLLFCLWRPDWMWPDRDRFADYKHLLLAQAMLIALCLTEFFVSRHHQAPFLAFFLPPFALLLTCLKLRDVRFSQWKTTPSFLLLIVLPLLLLVLGARDSVEAESVTLFIYTLLQVLALYGILAFVFCPPEFLVRGLRPSARIWQKIRLSPSTAYLILGSSMVLIISVLPALVFFRSAHDIEMATLVKHGQFHLARSLMARDERVRGEYLEIDTPQEYVADRISELKDRYVSFFFNTRRDDHTPKTQCDAGGHLFEEAMEMIRPIYNETAVETHELVHDATADCSYQWHPGKDSVELAKVADATGSLASFLPMKSDIPVLRWPGTSWGWFAVAAMILLTLSVIYWLVRFMARRIFLLNLSLPPTAAAVTSLGEVTENTLVLGMPHSGKSELLAKFRSVDVRKIAAGGTWEEEMLQEVPAETKVVAIDHFEYAMDEPECNGLKLRLLEKFLHANRTLVVASTCDPIDFSVSPPDRANRKKAKDEKLKREEYDSRAAQYRDRWANAWSTFTRRVYATTRADKANELKALNEAISSAGFTEAAAKELLRECTPTGPLCRIGIAIAGSTQYAELTEEQLITEVLDRARAYYRALWATCSKEEKIALFDLAQDGFVNATHPVLRRLGEHRLIVRNARLRLMNESFRRFVVETGFNEGVIALQKKEWSPWGVIRATLVAGAIALALLVFLTQRELLNRSTAFIGAVSAGIPALLKLFDLFRGRRTDA